MIIYERKKYLDRLLRVIGTPDIKVITGVRRSGKSKLLELLKMHFDNDINNNIIFIDFNRLFNEELKEYHNLNKYIEEHYKANKRNILMIDEVQMCDKFELVINSLHSSNKYDIYITGSNAFLLSSDLATLFTGRTFSIEVYPFSFKEFMDFYSYNDVDEAFDKYFFEGGFAGSYPYDSIEEKYDYIDKDVYQTIIVRDLMKKYKIRNKEVLENLCDYMLDNISNLASANNITNYLNSNNSSITDKTISNYIKYLCEAFVFYKVGRYDLRGKKYLSTESKYYLCDHTLKYAKLGTKQIDYGRTYENIVAIELMRRGYEIYVGKLYNKEIDFVAIKRNEQIYIQVSKNIDDEDTLKREVTPLLQIKDAYPKMIITRTKHDITQYEGIIIVDIARWLVKE